MVLIISVCISLHTCSSMLALMCSHDTTKNKAISSLSLFIELIQKDGVSQCDLEV